MKPENIHVAYDRECIKCKNHPMHDGDCGGKPSNISLCCVYNPVSAKRE